MRAFSERELAARDNDGIRIALLWHPREDSVTVSVEDSRAGDLEQGPGGGGIAPHAA